MMTKRFTGFFSFLAGIASALVLATAPASASIFNLDQNTAAVGASGSIGTVTLTQVGADVDVLVSLISGFGIVDTGIHHAFTFNLSTPATGVTFTTPAVGFSWHLVGSNPHFGSFTDVISCGVCGPGGSAPYVGPLDFLVLGASVSSFVGNPTYYFAVDTINLSTGATAAVGAVPEPETYALLLTGLGLLGFAARRRKQ